MSNYEAGKLYESVIEEVISDSRQDFEDSGIDETTLQELRKLWCEKLSSARIGRFSWDEDPEHNQAFALGNTITRSALKSDGLQISDNIDIPQMSSYPANNPIHGSDGGVYNMGIEIPSVKQEFDSGGLMIPKVNQADGAFELEINVPSEQGSTLISSLRKYARVQSDGSLEDDFENDNDIFNDSDEINSDLDDDLDSEKSEDEEAEQEGQIMLCLYDKVQRVKNKWKCNLKEGIANIEGRDYIFQRATGESEW